jgi:hypothetical protein
LLKRERGYLSCANQTKTAYSTAIGEADMLAISIEFPPGGFVLNGPIIVLKSRVALLAWFFAVLIKPFDGEAGTIGTGLTRLRVEVFGEGVFFCQNGTITLQIVRRSMLIHPLAQTLVANELHNADRFIDSRILLFVPIKLVLVDQHASCFLLSDRVLSYRKYCCMSRGESDETNQFLLNRKTDGTLT